MADNYRSCLFYTQHEKETQMNTCKGDCRCGCKERAATKRKWAASNWPELFGLRVEQVERIGGNFYASSSCYANETLSDASWFVPYELSLPVMIRKRDGMWQPRGF